MRLTPFQLEIIEAVHHNINTNYKHQVFIASFLKMYRISETTLTKGFKQHYGKTIYQHKLNLAMEYAHDCLRQGIPIKIISIELGYYSKGSFARAYKKIFQHNPKKPSSTAI